jgi:hypothetical protein
MKAPEVNPGQTAEWPFETDTGKVYVNGMDTADAANLTAIRRLVGMVFQNPDNQWYVGGGGRNRFWPGELELPLAEIRRG